MAGGLTALTLMAALSVRAVRVGRSVGRCARYWAVPQGQPGGLLYVALGDSVAQGVGATTPEHGYVGCSRTGCASARAAPFRS